MNRHMMAGVLLSLAVLSGCPENPQKGLIGSFRLGERAQIGTLVYTVDGTQYLISAGEGAAAPIPKNRFLVVHLNVSNTGAGQGERFIPAFSLIDDSGEHHNELDNGAGLPQWLGFARKVRPSESVNGDIVFDVAPKHYKLRIPDESDEHYAFVDLPLTFEDPAAAVESTAPAAAPR